MYKIIKRDGKEVEFDLSKISGAIEKAFVAQKREYNKQIIDMLALNAVSDCESKAVDGKVDVESIQDSVEVTLQRMGYEDVAKAYILYRNQRGSSRPILRRLFAQRKLTRISSLRQQTLTAFTIKTRTSLRTRLSTTSLLITRF